MKELVVISGKGGTGKTSLAGCFAALAAGSGVFTDCDVDAANLGLIMRPVCQEAHDFRASRKAFIREDSCSLCGRCRELCRFGAIRENFMVDPLSCEGCGVCFHACPEEAVAFDEVTSGRWFISGTPYGSLVHARLGVAEANSGKLVTLIREKAREIARNGSLRCIISDGPPGIGCPVIASLAGASASLVVTEPTVSGVQDMNSILAVCSHFQVPALMCINRYDLDEQFSINIEKLCEEKGVPLVGKIPLDREVTEAMVKGLPVIEYSKGEASRSIGGIWEQLRVLLAI